MACQFGGLFCFADKEEEEEEEQVKKDSLTHSHPIT